MLAFLYPVGLGDSNRAEISAVGEGNNMFRNAHSGLLLIEGN